ncbi:hypothetical protein ASD56_01360 [Microbacterium sp. Root166]|uniref:hypothetical protein n=1 Tax=Microbacterium sp. Root166 TaxID=1736478 RepID=UPI0006F61A0A|nr:hypothetical protein [Microbacterium sp. Root166]KQZ85049.1 hypothetical protein ASD56_01360 [Microbacterium sp. Root166]
MSDPTSPTPPQPGEPERTDSSAPVSPDAQPTEAYDAPAAQPTAAYPPSDFQPTEAYPPAAQGAYGQPGAAPYGQPGAPATAYADPAFAQAPAGATPPGSPDQRPRTLGWISLALAVGGLALVGAAYIPLLWVSVILAVIGGLLLLVALVLGIVTLASKKQGGKGLGLGAVIVAVLGGLAWIGAISLALLFVGLDAAANNSAAPESTPSSSAEATPDADEDDAEEEAEEPSGAYDEAAYLAEVRPGLTAILQEVDPSITEEMLGQIYTDEMLIELGTTLLSADEATREIIISSLASSAEGLFTEEQAQRFFDVILVAAEAHLQ